MKSLADALPPEIARQIHPDWRKNEAAYWSMRDQLLGRYQGQWIAFADGAVIAACKTSLEVLHTPGVVERHPFVTCVGREDQPYRIRRATFTAKRLQARAQGRAAHPGMPRPAGFLPRSGCTTPPAGSPVQPLRGRCGRGLGSPRVRCPTLGY